MTSWTKGLVGHWTLSSLDAKDSTAYDRDGTLQGNPQIVSGQVGNAMEFNRSNSEQVQTSTPAVDTFSVTCWVKPYQKNTYMGAVHRGNSNDNNRNLWLGVYDDSDTFGFLVMNGTKVTGGNITTNEWYFLAGTVENGASGSGTAKLYIDGELVGSANDWEISTANDETIIGNGRGGGNNYFDGVIDDVRIWNDRVLTQEIIREIGQQRVERRVRQA